MYKGKSGKGKFITENTGLAWKGSVKLEDQLTRYEEQLPAWAMVKKPALVNNVCQNY